MSVLKGLDKIIDVDPERFLKFISVGCDAIKFEDSTCRLCPMRTEAKTCIFQEKTLVEPECWDRWDLNAPKSDKDRSKLFSRTGKIHIKDVLNVYAEEDVPAIQEPEPFIEPVIPQFIQNYVNAFCAILAAMQEISDDYLYRFMDSTLEAQLNAEINAKIKSRCMEPCMDRFCIDCYYSNNSVLCAITPVDRDECDRVYKYLTTTEDIEPYLERSRPAKFLKEYRKGLSAFSERNVKI